ncbi:MAG: nucleoside triphosphate pyrophosphohydrolase [Candidatus Pacebacteria bacterium]|nr:nucleoside triphosphate pyrophosphohydrolase [Candidatus Paceibacterota bacterium]
MKVIKYNKLVRDKIPEIIEADNEKCEIEVLSDEKYLEMIDAKLDEEIAEYHQDKNLEELADLMEVIFAATRARGYSIEELEAVRVAKESKCGGFHKKILLKEVTFSE